MANLFITETTEDRGKVVFDTVLEDIAGGAVLNKTRLKSTEEFIYKGAPLYITGGVAELVKTATVVAGSTTTAVRVDKYHQFIVTDVVMLASLGKASAITAIDTSNDDYDVLTIATLGSTPAADAVLVQAAAAAVGTDSAAKYTPNCLLKIGLDTTEGNALASGVVRGTVREDALYYGISSEQKTALSLIRFD